MIPLQALAEVLGYLGTIAGAGICLWRIWKEYQKIREGIKCQLRAQMLQTYYKHKDSKQLRQYEAENFMLMYKAYKAMKGNSFIDEIYEVVITWQIET